VKLACLFTQTTLNDDGYPVRDKASSTYLETFEPAERFGQLVDAEARRRGAEHIRQLVFLGDGAAWICYPDLGVTDLVPVTWLSGVACDDARCNA
jgi:hypothetical protein